MSIASGSRVRLVYIEESVQGTLPATPAMRVLRAIQRNINYKKALLESQEVRADRNRADIRHGFRSSDGTFGFELSLQSYDDALEGVLASDWAVKSISGTPVLNVAAGKYVRATGSWITDGVKPGDYINATGFTAAANNVKSFVTAVSATDLTVTATLVNEAAAAGVITVPGKSLINGTTLKTYSVERQFLDIDMYQMSNGVAFNTMTLNVRPEQMVGGSFGMIGLSGAIPVDNTLANSVVDPPTSSPFSAFDGDLFIGGTSQAVITGMEVTVNNNRSLQPVVGSYSSPEVFEGECDVTGSLSVFLNTTSVADLLEAFANEETPALMLRNDDIDGTNYQTLVMPKIKINAGDIDPPRSGPAIVTMPFRALYDATAGCTIKMQRSNSSDTWT